MTKEQLLELGLTEEQATKAMGMLDGNFVTKTRFNEVNGELKTAKTTIAERDAQLETLQSAAGNDANLQQQITALQETNRTAAEQHTKEMAAVKIDGVVTAKLMQARAKNLTAAKALLADFLKTATMENDDVKGLDDAVKGLVESKETGFVFASDNPAQGGKWRGINPADMGSDSAGKGRQPASLADAVKIHFDKGSE